MFLPHAGGVCCDQILQWLAFHRKTTGRPQFTLEVSEPNERC